jgi:DMSO/TMAO reductase YedYZ molybdopterin-dependent catalytic subunit
MTKTAKPSLWTGALVGLLLTATLMALFFLGERLVGLPLVPLDMFDFIVPFIPGGLITFVIDIMVDSIIGLGLGEDVDTIAKTVEQAMAFGMVLGIGLVVGAAFFALGRRFEGRTQVAGAVTGGVLGLIFGGMSAASPFLGVAPAVAFIWVLLLFVGWGLAIGWIYGDLSSLPTQAGTAPTPTAESQQLGRREFLVRVGGATATLTVVGTGLGLALGGDGATTTVDGGDVESLSAGAGSGGDAVELADGALPNANAVVQPAPGMRPEYTPVAEHYRIDIATRPIEIDLATWTLPFSGLIAEPREFTMDELRDNFEPVSQFVTMQCISNRLGGNLISTTKWTGVPVRDVLNELELEEDAAWLLIEGGDNFFEYVSIDMIMNDPNITFTYDFDDQPLPQRNGFPLRIYIPDRYGMKQPKWINNIIVTDSDERGYWVRRGWSADAIMQTTSIVDTVATDDIYEDENAKLRVPIGGFAVAGVRGISKVEIQINEGEWTEAQLRDPISDRTWVFWRYDWAFEEGEHNFAVRCYDGDGDLQPTNEQGVRPDGATGIHTASATLTSEAETVS